MIEKIEYIKDSNLFVSEQELSELTGAIQAELQEFSEQFNKENGTLLIYVYGNGRYGLDWKGISEELNIKMFLKRII
jgi:hypothetical protein